MVNVEFKDTMTITQTYANGNIGTLELNENQANDLYKRLHKLFGNVVDTNTCFDVCEYCRHEDKLEFEYPCNDCANLNDNSFFEPKVIT